MTRTAFFSTLSALLATVAAKAQSTIITPCRPRIRWGEQIPLCNGQCPNPECDFKADPWAWEKDPTTGFWITSASIHVLYPTLPLEFSEPYKTTYPPRLNRCPKCNTAFWQDPEKPQ